MFYLISSADSRCIIQIQLNLFVTKAEFSFKYLSDDYWVNYFDALTEKFWKPIDPGCDGVDLERDAVVEFGLDMIVTDCGTIRRIGLFICFCKDIYSNL